MAHGGSRIGKDFVYAVTFVKRAERAQRFDGLRDAQRTQKPVDFHVLRKTDGFFQLVHNDKISAVQNIGNNNPGGIGSQIDNSNFFHNQSAYLLFV